MNQPLLSSLNAALSMATPSVSERQTVAGAKLTGPDAAPAGGEPVSSAQIEAAAKQIGDAVRQLASSLEFSVDQNTGRTVVKVVDKATDTVIRQIPSEEALAIARALDRLQGLILRQEA